MTSIKGHSVSSLTDLESHKKFIYFLNFNFVEFSNFYNRLISTVNIFIIIQSDQKSGAIGITPITKFTIASTKGPISQPFR